MQQQRVNHSVADLIADLRRTEPQQAAEEGQAKPAKKKTKRANDTGGKRKVVEVVSEAVDRPASQQQQQPHQVDEEEPIDDSIDDPYCVRDARFTHVSRQEYSDSSRVSLDPGITFDFARFKQVSRRAYYSAAVTDPQQFYAHDPIVMFDAVALAGNLEAAARRTATQVPYERLVLTENNDVARVIETMGRDEKMRDAVKSAGLEYLFALMAVENATRHPPDSVRELLK